MQIWHCSIISNLHKNLHANFHHNRSLNEGFAFSPPKSRRKKMKLQKKYQNLENSQILHWSIISNPNRNLHTNFHQNQTVNEGFGFFIVISQRVFFVSSPDFWPPKCCQILMKLDIHDLWINIWARFFQIFKFRIFNLFLEGLWFFFYPKKRFFSQKSKKIKKIKILKRRFSYKS